MKQEMAEHKAELLVAGRLANWPRLRIAPHLTILPGEDAWRKFVDHPPAGALAAALEAIRRYGEEWPS